MSGDGTSTEGMSGDGTSTEGISGDGTSTSGEGTSMVFSPSVVSDVVSVVSVVVVWLSLAESSPHAVSNHPAARAPETAIRAWREIPACNICVLIPIRPDPVPGLRETRYPKESPVNERTSHRRERAQPRLTLPAFRQEVHTLTRCLLPPGRATARTDWMFGSHRRLVRRWECDTD